MNSAVNRKRMLLIGVIGGLFINTTVNAELIFGTSARTQFEDFHRRLGDSFVDFEDFDAKTNLTTEIDGLTFKTTEDRAFQNNNPIDTGVNIICSQASPFSASCEDENHQIAGVREGNTTDGQSLYEINFSTPQRRVGIERNWNTHALTHFYNGSTLLATHQNTANSEFVGYISNSNLITRIVLDGEVTDIGEDFPRGIYQVGYSDDLFYGSTVDGISDDDDDDDNSDVLTVSDDKGDAIIATSITVDTTHTSVPVANSIVTDDDDEISLVDEDDTKVTIKPNTLVTQHPKQVVDAKTSKKTTLLRGTLDLIVPVAARDYLVSTPIADILIAGTQLTQRANGSDAAFNVQYSQTGFDGNMTISVTSGSVEVTGRDGSTKTLSAGQELSLSGQVQRSNWVLPIDGDFLYGGKENTLSWLAYPNAAGYLLEYTFPSPNFAETNPADPEFTNKTILFSPSQYTIWQDLVIVPLMIPDLPGSIVEARIFPINSSGNVINGSSGSDTGTYTFK